MKITGSHPVISEGSDACRQEGHPRVVQRILGHRSLQSTEAYLKSLTDREVWTAFRTAAA